jgi:hypothetical protein
VKKASFFSMQIFTAHHRFLLVNLTMTLLLSKDHLSFCTRMFVNALAQARRHLLMSLLDHNFFLSERDA